jgi:hypothetical protein
MIPVLKNELPPEAPPVPRGYKIFYEDGRVYAQAPADKRKSKGRVPAKPMCFTLYHDVEKMTMHWEEEGQYGTIPVRNLMIKQGLQTEIKFGMKLTGKAPKYTTILRQEFGMSGTPVSLYMQWCRFKSFTPDTKIAEAAMAEGELT